jgi:EpsI family protein
MSRPRSLIPALILVVGCLFLWRAHMQVAVPLREPLTSAFPQLNGYRTEDQVLTDDERTVAGMSDYVARIYWRDSTIAYSTLVSYYARQTQGKTIHSPRNCLPGAGWEIMQAGTRVVNVDGDAYALNRDVLRNGSSTALVYYWYQGRGRVTANEYAVKWNLLRDAALLGHTEEALVRVVVPLPTPAAVASKRGAAPPAPTLAVYDAQAEDMASRLIRGVSRVIPGERTLTTSSLGTTSDAATKPVGAAQHF